MRPHAWVCGNCKQVIRNRYDRFTRRLEYRREDAKERPHSITLGLICRNCMEIEVASGSHFEQIEMFV